MLQNAYLDAKIGFDTEENEPPKVWGELFIIHYSFAALPEAELLELGAQMMQDIHARLREFP